MHAYRTHTCAELRAANVGETVRLSGWVHRKRDHGHLLFVDVRDHYGITQIVTDTDSAAFKTLDRLRVESVVTVEGEVVARSKETVNPNLGTGEIEVRATNVTVQSAAANPQGRKTSIACLAIKDLVFSTSATISSRRRCTSFPLGRAQAICNIPEPWANLWADGW